MGSRSRVGGGLIFGGLIFGMVFAAGCRRDPCEVDSIESNNSASEATDLGVFSDQETRMELPLTLHNEADVDVFTFDVVDQGSDGNPELFLWATGQDDETLTLSVNFHCASDVMVAFSCDGFEQPSELGGGFCTRTGRGEQHLDVTYDCEGSLIDDTDNGVAVVTVSREGAGVGGICAAYDLEIFTD